jgi:hypothetical protein
LDFGHLRYAAWAQYGDVQLSFAFRNAWISAEDYDWLQTWNMLLGLAWGSGFMQ